ncbi:MAG: hypothetical protein K6A65_02635 [Succinivibrionaceae bacterium]|nr:hypothetical protein [Succinivibrionaceae bacterium]
MKAMINDIICFAVDASSPEALEAATRKRNKELERKLSVKPPEIGLGVYFSSAGQHLMHAFERFANESGIPGGR